MLYASVYQLFYSVTLTKPLCLIEQKNKDFLMRVRYGMNEKQIGRKAEPIMHAIK